MPGIPPRSVRHLLQPQHTPGQQSPYVPTPPPKPSLVASTEATPQPAALYVFEDWSPSAQSSYSCGVSEPASAPVPVGSSPEPVPAGPSSVAAAAGSSSEPVPAGSSSELLPAGSSSEPVPARSSSEPVPTRSSSEPVPARSSSEPVPAGSSSEAVPAGSSSEAAAAAGSSSSEVDDLRERVTALGAALEVRCPRAWRSPCRDQPAPRHHRLCRAALLPPPAEACHCRQVAEKRGALLARQKQRLQEQVQRLQSQPPTPQPAPATAPAPAAGEEEEEERAGTPTRLPAELSVRLEAMATALTTHRERLVCARVHTCRLAGVCVCSCGAHADEGGQGSRGAVGCGARHPHARATARPPHARALLHHGRALVPGLFYLPLSPAGAGGGRSPRARRGRGACGGRCAGACRLARGCSPGRRRTEPVRGRASGGGGRACARPRVRTRRPGALVGLLRLRVRRRGGEVRGGGGAGRAGRGGFGDTVRHGRADDALGGELERPHARERRYRGRRRVELARGAPGSARQRAINPDPSTHPAPAPKPRTAAHLPKPTQVPHHPRPPSGAAGPCRARAAMLRRAAECAPILARCAPVCVPVGQAVVEEMS